jgi:hypothetical protein
MIRTRQIGLEWVAVEIHSDLSRLIDAGGATFAHRISMGYCASRRVWFLSVVNDGSVFEMDNPEHVKYSRSNKVETRWHHGGHPHPEDIMLVEANVHFKRIILFRDRNSVEMEPNFGVTANKVFSGMHGAKAFYCGWLARAAEARRWYTSAAKAFDIKRWIPANALGKNMS